jgi:hypothetical protein
MNLPILAARYANVNNMILDNVRKVGNERAISRKVAGYPISPFKVTQKISFFSLRSPRSLRFKVFYLTAEEPAPCGGSPRCGDWRGAEYTEGGGHRGIYFREFVSTLKGQDPLFKFSVFLKIRYT